MAGRILLARIIEKILTKYTWNSHIRMYPNMQYRKYGLIDDGSVADVFLEAWYGCYTFLCVVSIYMWHDMRKEYIVKFIQIAIDRTFHVGFLYFSSYSSVAFKLPLNWRAPAFFLHMTESSTKSLKISAMYTYSNHKMRWTFTTAKIMESRQNRIRSKILYPTYILHSNSNDAMKCEKVKECRVFRHLSTRNIFKDWIAYQSNCLLELISIPTITTAAATETDTWVVKWVVIARWWRANNKNNAKNVIQLMVDEKWKPHIKIIWLRIFNTHFEEISLRISSNFQMFDSELFVYVRYIPFRP